MEQLTLKSRAMAFVEADMADTLEPIRSADEMSLEELKCETDSMMALATYLISRGLGHSAVHQQVMADRLRESTPEGGNVLETIQQDKDGFIEAVLVDNFRSMRDAGRATDLVDRLEYYRQAYYERSPEADGIEAHYSSSENLLTTGISTEADRFAMLLYSFNAAANQIRLSGEQKVILARKSDHLPILLAKMSGEDESRLGDLLKDHDFLVVALVKIKEYEDGPQAVFNQQIIAKMRELYPEKRPKYAHRHRTGCPAAVSFDGHDSAIAELWGLTVGVLEKYGFWKDSQAHILSGLVAGPDAG